MPKEAQGVENLNNNSGEAVLITGYLRKYILEIEFHDPEPKAFYPSVLVRYAPKSYQKNEGDVLKFAALANYSFKDAVDSYKKMILPCNEDKAATFALRSFLCEGIRNYLRPNSSIGTDSRKTAAKSNITKEKTMKALEEIKAAADEAIVHLSGNNVDAAIASVQKIKVLAFVGDGEDTQQDNGTSISGEDNPAVESPLQAA